MVRTYTDTAAGTTDSESPDSAVGAYLEKMANLRAVEQSLKAAAPGSPDYKKAATRYERLTRELMDDFARAVRSVRVPTGRINRAGG